LTQRICCGKAPDSNRIGGLSFVGRVRHPELDPPSVGLCEPATSVHCFLDIFFILLNLEGERPDDFVGMLSRMRRLP